MSLIFVLLLLFKCAFKVAPSGGPVDKTPPEIIFTFPAKDSTGVDKITQIEIYFNEAIDKASLKNQVWLLPELPGGFELKWKGSKKLRIVLRDSLEGNQTYILTLGTGIKDLRRNRFPSPFVLPFSTGNRIDRGEISGRVLVKKPEGIFIYAYMLSDTTESGTIARYRPHYYTQVGAKGIYQLKYLKPGHYRIYALEDINRDGLYTPQVDRIGIPSRDVKLDSSHLVHQNLNFTLIREDTTRPVLMRVDTLHRQAIELSFSEPLLDDQVFKISVTDSLTGRKLPVIAAALRPGAPNRLVVYTNPQQRASYIGLINAVQDTARKFSREEHIRFRFRGASLPDTMKHRLRKITPPRDQKDVVYSARIVLEFSHPVDTSSLHDSFSLLTADSLKVPGTWNFSSPLLPKFIPDLLLRKNHTYRILLDLPKTRSLLGKTFGDSLLSSSFTTRDWEELGEISGTVWASDAKGGTALLEALPLRGPGIFTISAEIGKPYLLPFLPAGSYLLRAILDINQNKRYDPGQSSPLVFSEPFLVYSDTVKVRKRWTSQGIDFNFDY